MDKNYYLILGVHRTANDEEIKEGYKRLALKYHPDNTDHPMAKEQFQEICEAFAVLSNKAKRKIYDREEELKYNNQQMCYEQPSADMTTFLVGGAAAVIVGFTAYQLCKKKGSD